METQLNVNPHRSLKREGGYRPIVEYRGLASATLSADMVSIPPDYKYRSVSARGPRAKPQSFIILLPFTSPLLLLLLYIGLLVFALRNEREREREEKEVGMKWWTSGGS